MRAHRAVLSSIGLATLLGACGSSQPTPPPPKPAAAPAKPAVPAVAQAPAPEDKVDVPKYDPRGRREGGVEVVVGQAHRRVIQWTIMWNG